MFRGSYCGHLNSAPPGTVVFPAAEPPGLLGRAPECGSLVAMETDQFRGSWPRGRQMVWIMASGHSVLLA